MILKLLFLSQISNARELESDVPDARLDARDDPKYYKKIAYEEIELTEDDLVWTEGPVISPYSFQHMYGLYDAGAFYSPKHIPEEFFLLGDKHCRGWRSSAAEKPNMNDDCKKLIVVKDISYRDMYAAENALVKPKDAFMQWKAIVDGDVTVTVFILDAGPGYQCVGDVALKGDYDKLPDEIMDRYRCVKNAYLEHILLGR